MSALHLNAECYLQLQIDLRDKRVVSRTVEHEMHMTWPVRVALQLAEKFSHRTVTWDWIWDRDNGLEPEPSILVTSQNRTPIRSLTL